MNASPKVQYLPSGGVVSTLFVYQSAGIQNAANSVYAQKSTVDGQYAAANPAAPKKYIFRTDYERMQYIVGKQGTVPKCSGY